MEVLKNTLVPQALLEVEKALALLTNPVLNILFIKYSWKSNLFGVTPVKVLFFKMSPHSESGNQKKKKKKNAPSILICPVG